MSWACTGIYELLCKLQSRPGLKAESGMKSPLQDTHSPTNFDNLRLPPNLQFAARTNLAVPTAAGVASDIFHLEVVPMRRDRTVSTDGPDEGEPCTRST